MSPVREEEGSQIFVVVGCSGTVDDYYEVPELAFA